MCSLTPESNLTNRYNQHGAAWEPQARSGLLGESFCIQQHGWWTVLSHSGADSMVRSLLRPPAVHRSVPSTLSWENHLIYHDERLLKVLFEIWNMVTTNYTLIWRCFLRPLQPFLMASTTWTKNQWLGSLWGSASLSSASSYALSSLSAEARTGTEWCLCLDTARAPFPWVFSVCSDLVFVSLQEIFSC